MNDTDTPWTFIRDAAHLGRALAPHDPQGADLSLLTPTALAYFKTLSLTQRQTLIRQIESGDLSALEAPPLDLPGSTPEEQLHHLSQELLHLCQSLGFTASILLNQRAGDSLYGQSIVALPPNAALKSVIDPDGDPAYQIDPDASQTQLLDTFFALTQLARDTDDQLKRLQRLLIDLSFRCMRHQHAGISLNQELNDLLHQVHHQAKGHHQGEHHQP